MRGDTNISDVRPGITLIDETYLLKVGRACLFLYLLMVDSYIKKVSKSYARNLDRAEANREKQQKVLLLGFWFDLTDVEIAEKMEVTTRTVYNLKRRAFSKVKEFYEKRGRDP